MGMKTRLAKFLSDSNISSPQRGEDKGEGVNKHRILSLAKHNRRNPTIAEQKMWALLRRKNLGYTFKRQHPIGNYIVDFVCLEIKLVIECDGGQHNDVVDSKRSCFLESKGFKIIRFWNNDILSNLDGITIVIKQNLPSPVLLAARGAEQNFLSQMGEDKQIPNGIEKDLL